MLWATSPACTELETRVLDWIADMLDLPASFRSSSTGGGVIQDSASSANLVAVLAGRERATNFGANEDGCNQQLTAYTSAHAHSSMEKGIKVAGIGRKNLRAIEVDEKFAMRPDALIIIDSPDFTHRVARRVRKAAPSIPIINYAPPTVWAWRPWRARAMRRYVDEVLAILPFEPAAFARLSGVNIVGMRRRKFPPETIRAVRSAYKSLFFGAGTLADRLVATEAQFGHDPGAAQMIAFVREKRERPLCFPGRHMQSDAG